MFFDIKLKNNYFCYREGWKFKVERLINLGEDRKLYVSILIGLLFVGSMYVGYDFGKDFALRERSRVEAQPPVSAATP